MANEKHLAILKQGVEAWNKWRQENPGAKPDLSGADLSGAKLIEAILSGADLFGAKLFEANLRDAFLIEANLSGADLSMAYLIGADFMGASLMGANLRDAVLITAFLCRADLRRADLRAATLIGGELSGANVEYAKVEDTVFGDVDLSEVTGLETVQHDGPSTIGIDTIYKSKGKIPEVFLRGCGVPDRMIDFIDSLVGQPETNLIRLRMMLDKHFDKSELKTLCFDMGIDYDSLNGENKSDKARELVAYCDRRRTIPDLVTKCRELRPKVSWEGEYE